MRIFFGVRGTDKKKSVASQQFKNQMLGKKSDAPKQTAEEKYRAVLDAKMDEIMSQVALGKKKGFKLPGTKEDDAPKEVSRHFKATMEELARKKLQKAMDKQKKKERALMFAKKAKLKAEQHVITLEQNKKLLAAKQAEAAKSSSGSYWFGYSPES